MLYNRHLDWLITVSDLGSFSKAAQQLYVSSTAVMKQMDELESQLGFKILNRSNQGVSLTKAGHSIYNDAKEIIQLSNQAIKKAHQISENAIQSIYIGTSFLNPYQPIRDLWLKADKNHSDFKLHIIPYETEVSYMNTIIDYVGDRFDIIVGGLDESNTYDKYEIYPLAYKRFNCLMSANHPLSKNKSVHLKDLIPYSLLIANPGESNQHDRLRKKITSTNLHINLKNIPFYYGMELFNQVQNSQDILVAYEGWQDAHPSLVAIPLEWDATIPYGIIYAKDAPEKVKHFIKIITEQD